MNKTKVYRPTNEIRTHKARGRKEILDRNEFELRSLRIYASIDISIRKNVYITLHMYVWHRTSNYSIKKQVNKKTTSSNITKEPSNTNNEVVNKKKIKTKKPELTVLKTFCKIIYIGKH